MIEKTCCFTGHRKMPPDDTDGIRRRLIQTIDHLYSEGITIYYVGGAQGFDALAAEAVIERRAALEYHVSVRSIQRDIEALAQIESTARYHPGVRRTVSVSMETMLRLNRFQADKRGSVCEVGELDGGLATSLRVGAMDLAWKVLSDAVARVYSGYHSGAPLFVYII